MEQLCNDLAVEQQELDAVVANLDEAGWQTMTPAEGWDIKEQIRRCNGCRSPRPTPVRRPEVENRDKILKGYLDK